MLTEEGHAELISAIYDAGLDFEQWPKALELLAEVLRATGGCLLRQNLVTGEGAMFNVRSDPKFGQLYNEYFHQLNILPQRAASQPPGTCLTDRMIVSKSEFKKTEFYNDYLRRFKVQGVLKAYVFADGDWEGYVSFGSRSTGPDWEKEHIELLSRIAPHLHRATQINARLQSQPLVRIGAVEVLDKLAQGVIVIDGLGWIDFLNRAAEKMIIEADGIAIKDRTLEMGRKSESALLHRMIASAIQGERRDAAGGTLLISRPSRKRPYSVLVSPLSISYAWPLPQNRGALIFIQDPEKKASAASEAYLRKVYRLTQAEAAVTIELMHGGGLKAVASRLGIAVSTARSHLKNIFLKTNVHSQAELIRLMVELRTTLEHA